MLVLSVIAIFVAFVAVVAVVAELALPVKAPTNVVLVTDVNPTMVVALDPKLIAVEPTVMLELTKAELGIDVKPAPDPLNPVAVNIPVLGLNCSLVLEVYSFVIVPDVWLANNGYRVPFVVVSSVTVVTAVGADHVGVPAPALVNTWPEVPALVNA